MPNVFVDCEGGPYPTAGGIGGLREFGAVLRHKDGTIAEFHGKLKAFTSRVTDPEWEKLVLGEFEVWLKEECAGLGKPTFVSDNPAYDWQFINEAFHRVLGHNPFGFSARRIGDYYAGLIQRWDRTQAWKKLRVTRHDHNPVHDAIGNLEAWERLEAGERPNPDSTKAEKRRYY